MILYKYFPCNANSFKSISLKGLWCHHSNKMNDPFECLANAEINFTKEEIGKIRKYAQASKDERVKSLGTLDDSGLILMFNSFRKKLIEEFAFSSLSERFDDILMWSHYASSHSGFVFGFEFKNFKDHSLQKVRYVNSIEGFDPISHLKIIEGDYSHPNMDQLIKDLSQKAQCWNYEKEWRIWMKEPTYYHFEPDELKEIYFGVNCDIETKSIILQLTSYLPNEFNFFQMEFGDNPIRLKY